MLINVPSTMNNKLEQMIIIQKTKIMSDSEKSYENKNKTR